MCSQLERAMHCCFISLLTLNLSCWIHPSFRDSFRESVVGKFSEFLNSEKFVVLKFEMFWLLNLWVQSCFALNVEYVICLFPSI